MVASARLLQELVGAHFQTTRFLALLLLWESFGRRRRRGGTFFPSSPSFSLRHLFLLLFLLLLLLLLLLFLFLLLTNSRQATIASLSPKFLFVRNMAPLLLNFHDFSFPFLFLGEGRRKDDDGGFVLLLCVRCGGRPRRSFKVRGNLTNLTSNEELPSPASFEISLNQSRAKAKTRAIFLSLFNPGTLPVHVSERERVRWNLDLCRVHHVEKLVGIAEEVDYSNEKIEFDGLSTAT